MENIQKFLYFLLVSCLKLFRVAQSFQNSCLFFELFTSQLLNFSQLLTSCEMVAYRGCLQKRLSVRHFSMLFWMAVLKNQNKMGYTYWIRFTQDGLVLQLVSLGKANNSCLRCSQQNTPKVPYRRLGHIQLMTRDLREEMTNHTTKRFFGAFVFFLGCVYTMIKLEFQIILNTFQNMIQQNVVVFIKRFYFRKNKLPSLFIFFYI